MKQKGDKPECGINLCLCRCCCTPLVCCCPLDQKKGSPGLWQLHLLFKDGNVAQELHRNNAVLIRSYLFEHQPQNSDFFSKLRSAVHPSNMARIGVKLWKNAFLTIPDISFFDTQNNFSAILFFQKWFFSKKWRFGRAMNFWPSLADSSSKVIACSFFIFGESSLAKG